MIEEYIPYGPEWEQEMMKLTKNQLIGFIRREIISRKAAESAIPVDNWVDVKDGLPEKKEGWSHSNPVIVWYAGNERDIETFGIAYYHYDPPYQTPGFIDFQRYGRQPQKWKPITPPKQKS